MEEAIKCLNKEIHKLIQKQKPYLDIASISDGNVAVRSMVDYYNEKIDNLVKAVEILKKSE